jgi:hypothetical protein
VIHVAGLEAVGQSVENPFRDWTVNPGGTRQLLATMQAHGCLTLVFSSMATHYRMPERGPVPETALILSCPTTWWRATMAMPPEPWPVPPSPPSGWVEAPPGLAEMCCDDWPLQSDNSNGYGHTSALEGAN